MADSKQRRAAESTEREASSSRHVTTRLGPLLQATGAARATLPVHKRSPGSPVRPRRARASAEERALELAARKRVAALVSGGLHFKIKREPGFIQGQRGSGSAKLVARLASKGFVPEVTLDLRAQPDASTGEAIASFVRVHHRRGVQQLSIVFDASRGAGGTDSAVEPVVAALTLGPVAALVRAFSSAHVSRGGSSTLAVLLI